MSTAPPPSLGRELLEAFFTLFVGTAVQVGRAFWLLGQGVRRAAAFAAYRKEAIAVGRRMHQLSVGSQMLRQQLTALEAEGASAARVEVVLYELGQSGVETSVPLPNVEPEWEQGRRVREAYREAARQYRQTAERLWPKNAIGWFGLLGSYALTGFVLWLLVGRIPSGTPTVVAGEVTIRAPRVVLGRQVILTAGRQRWVEDDDPTLRIVLTVSNEGKTPVTYRSFRGREAAGVEGARLTDGEKPVPRTGSQGDAVPEGGVQEATVEPGRTVEDILVFEAPDANFRTLELFLPGGNVGRPDETLRLTIPASYVEKLNRPR